MKEVRVRIDGGVVIGVRSNGIIRVYSDVDASKPFIEFSAVTIIDSHLADGEATPPTEETVTS